MNFHSLISDLLSDKRKLAWYLFWAIIGLSVLRSWVVNSQNSVPAEVIKKIQNQYISCISSQDTPIWPGEPRQPECGNTDIRVLGKGIVPEEQKANGITEAICYRLTYENPYWSTLGTTRHEVKSSERTTYQVTILENRSWQVFPDNELENRQRWAMYSCPDY